MRQRIQRAAAIAIVAVFASLPTLARVHDRLSASDAPTAYRVSRNLERPHDRHITQGPVDAVTSTAAVQVVWTASEPTDESAASRSSIAAVPPRQLRAPPAV